jgi:hypothetical protein
MKEGWENLDVIYLAHNGDKWQDFVNMAMNLQVPKTGSNFLTI